MNHKSILAAGERAAMSGYLPQFDEFAWFVYQNLCNQQLEWIKVADPEAEKLDDIQYSTYSEIHAYQVKWTIADAKISYLNFCELLPLIASSWKKIKSENPGTKQIIPHLITNKALSAHDSILSGKKVLGSFQHFIHEVWVKIKTQQSYDKKWHPVIKNIKNISKLNDPEFIEFISVFDFQPDYKKKEFTIGNAQSSIIDEDLVALSRFIIEKVASKERPISFERTKIISFLNWTDRFNTTFKHDLIIDRQKYQPINATIEELNAKLLDFNSGYLFLIGGPGSGKSSLLSYWSSGRPERIIRFFAFDFTNPSSSSHNYFERGDATVLFYDLVKQMNNAGLSKKNVLPHKDLKELKDTFFEQLALASQEYKVEGKKTVLIIDGLDHVPREYQGAKNNFLKELFIPSEIPEGVNIILGSQSYELQDIRQEVKKEFLYGTRTIRIAPLTKVEVYQYLIDYSLDGITNDQKTLVFEISQGHPLYLSYLVERVRMSTDIDETLKSFPKIDDNIDNYYNSLWIPIEKDDDLTKFIGLIARINGPINLDFINEWGFLKTVQMSFNNKARLLFNENHNELNFFHNSYKQFLLNKTAFNYIKKEYDESANINYHKQLAEYYKKSTVEPSWRESYHLFQSQQYDEFAAIATPDSFTIQFLSYRPPQEIKQDIKLGIEIAKNRKDVHLLIRYLFALAEIESRLFNIDPASFTEELLVFGKASFAKRYLRTQNMLHCNDAYALKASRLFIENDDKTEGAILFNLVNLDTITKDGIVITEFHRYEEAKRALEEWVYTSPNFIDCEAILFKINNIEFTWDKRHSHFQGDESDLRIALLSNLAQSLMDYNKWDDLDKVIAAFQKDNKKEVQHLFSTIESAIIKSLDNNDNNRAKKYLATLLTHFKKEKALPTGKIFIADLIYKVTGDSNTAFEWIKDVAQPSNVGTDNFGYEDSLHSFMPLLKLNKILNVSGNGVPITVAVPSATPGTDEEVMVEFERMLCLIAQILSDGLSKVPLPVDILKRIYPIIQFFYKDVSHHNRYWYRLTQAKGTYYDYLIYSISTLNNESLQKLGDYLFEEFESNPSHWPSSLQSKVIKSLLLHGYNVDKAKAQILLLETSMLSELDIDGRIAQCIAHAKIWIVLNELDLAERWIKQAIQESIGVGYRKDYQFSAWIDWLGKINQMEPEAAPERISWFLSHLQHIKETTEGRAYWNASDEILKVTFNWNLNAGLKQLQWQLKEGLIDFKDSIYRFIEAYINRVLNESEYASGLKLYSEVLLLISESANVYLLNILLSKGYSVIGERFLQMYLPNLIDAIKINSLEETRFLLLSAIDEFCEKINNSISKYYKDFQIPENTDRRGASNSNSNTLTLNKGYGKLSEEEVLKKVNSFDNFETLIQNEDRANSYFDWSKVVDKIASALTIEQLKKISDIAKIGRRESDFYAKLSEYAFLHGDVNFAIELANKSLNLSSESGWVKFYDGGTRINAFNALKRIDTKFATEKAFDVFSYDIISGNYSRNYLEHLEDILPLITDKFDVKFIWPEIYGYLKRLMSNSSQSTDLPELEYIDQPINETLIDYLIYLSQNPIRIISEKSKLLLAINIDEGKPYALSKFISNSFDPYVLNDIMMCLLELKSDKLIELKTILQQHAISRDYLLRKDAGKMLSFLNEDIPVPVNINAPQIYNLHLLPYKKLEVEKELDPYFPEVDINDPEDMTRPFGFILRFLSNRSDIDETNLLFRSHSIMHEIGNPEEWTVEYEKGFRFHLEQVYLKYPYTRPRVISAKRAIMRVVGELVDAGYIHDNKALVQITTSRDYKTLFFKAIPKPSFVQILKENEYGSVERGWVNRIGDSIRLQGQLIDYDAMKVIGEYTHVQCLDWGTPSEIFMSQIAIIDKIRDDSSYIFGKVFQRLTEDYYNIEGAGPYIIIIRDQRYEQFDVKSKWIAINPALAKELGWEPQLDKLFGWKDKNGNTMVESIYWSNGNTDMQPRKDSEIGEGWMVIASEEALFQMSQVCPQLFIQKSLHRSKYNDSIYDEKLKNTIIPLELQD